jgi:hypothetical protein
LITFCRSAEYSLVPVNSVLPLELELELELEELELEPEFAVKPMFDVAVEPRELTEVAINDSWAGQDKSSYPAREGSCPGVGLAPAMSGFS